MSRKLEDLYVSAHMARMRAYSPYSNYAVGAALRTTGQNIFSGCNVETANYKGTCAEAGAIAAMVHGGETRIQDIVIIGPGLYLCSPCGDCRQRIREFADDDTMIHVLNDDGKLLKTYTMEQLLPDSFGPENLKP